MEANYVKAPSDASDDNRHDAALAHETVPGTGDHAESSSSSSAASNSPPSATSPINAAQVAPYPNDPNAGDANPNNGNGSGMKQQLLADSTATDGDAKLPASSATYDPVTGGTENIPMDELNRIARRFQPRVWLAKNEHYRPASIPHYLQQCNLFYDPVGKRSLSDYMLVKENPTLDDLSNAALFDLLMQVKERTHDSRLDGITKDNMDPGRFHCALQTVDGRKGVPWSDIDNVPFYCRMRRYSDHWEIVYALSFCFNGPYNICGCKEVGAHSADLEHITVRTNQDATKLEWCFFGAHGTADGVWCRFSEMDSVQADMPDPTRPVVYAADHSHGAYPKPGTWIRICCFANDKVSGGAGGPNPAWDPKVSPILLFDPRDPRFNSAIENGVMLYHGTLAEDGVAPPSGQGWWTSETNWTNNWFRRAYWPCRYIPLDCCYYSCMKQVDFNK